MNITLEWDEVIITDDLNECVDKIKKKIKDARSNNESSGKIEALQEELRLYYVATSRARKKLTNATQLPKGVIKG